MFSIPTVGGRRRNNRRRFNHRRRFNRRRWYSRRRRGCFSGRRDTSRSWSDC
jgi:hypothetical protein